MLEDSHIPSLVGTAEIQKSRQTRVACKTDMKQARTRAPHRLPDFLRVAEEVEDGRTDLHVLVDVGLAV